MARFLRIQPAQALAVLAFASIIGPQTGARSSDEPDSDLLATIIDRETSEFRDVVERWAEDRSALRRRYPIDYSPRRRDRLRAFHDDWLDRLENLDSGALGLQGRVDAALLAGQIRYELALLDREEQRAEEMADLLPIDEAILDLVEDRRGEGPQDPKAAAEALERLVQRTGDCREALESDDRADEDCGLQPTPSAALRASETVEALARDLGRWSRFFSGYDPLFSWWVEAPRENAEQALQDYAKYLREEVAGLKEGDEDSIVGDPIGAEGLEADLLVERIPYTPEELIAIAEREFAWCEAEAQKAIEAMGAEDWQEALERTKQDYVEPGRQPQLIRDLAEEATRFVEERDLVTVPPLAKEVWRMEMMSPERQKVNPYFLGGESIIVSFPTDGMEHEDKLMSLRSNNTHFCRATVLHEVIPGHHLQQFMTSRFGTHRRPFSTPFWTEGWALYWEMRFWDLGFPETPENRVGMLFWRMHRCARILFSLKFHLGEMTPEEAVDFLVERVGHERAAAEAEVRRSFNGSYPPLYQCAYMLGALQFRALREEIVGAGRMTDREFHDRILQAGNMPIEMVRALLLGEAPDPDQEPSWRFAGPE